jgi:putative ABC transport system ATP-binding protein
VVEDSSAIIRAEKLTKIYFLGKVQVLALKDISLSIPRGTFLGITGPSGSGKSTFLNLVGGLDTPTSGAIHTQGKIVSQMSNEELARYRRVDVGMIFQSDLLPHRGGKCSTSSPFLWSSQKGKKTESIGSIE